MTAEHPRHETIIALYAALVKMRTLQANIVSLTAYQLLTEAIQYAESALEFTEYALVDEDKWRASDNEDQ